MGGWGGGRAKRMESSDRKAGGSAHFPLPSPQPKQSSHALPPPLYQHEQQPPRKTTCKGGSPLVHLVVGGALPPPHVVLAVRLSHDALVARAAGHAAGQRPGMPVKHPGQGRATRHMATASCMHASRRAGWLARLPILPACGPSWRPSRWPARRPPRCVCWAHTAAPAGRRGEAGAPDIGLHTTSRRSKT